MRPTGEMYACIYESPVGILTALSSRTHLISLSFGDRRQGVQQENQVLLRTKAWLDSYFHRQKPSPEALPLEMQGTAFARLVWEELLKIPYGQVVTYGELAGRVAARMGKPRMASQAIGGAVGRNPLAIIVPCHRVVGAGGEMVGYNAGIDKKIALLRHERL